MLPYAFSDRRSRKCNVTYNYKKIILCQVGKTTLSQCLRKKAKSSVGTISTDGINIDPWPAFYVTSPDDKVKKEVELTVWDFAGQGIV